MNLRIIHFTLSQLQMPLNEWRVSNVANLQCMGESDWIEVHRVEWGFAESPSSLSSHCRHVSVITILQCHSAWTKTYHFGSSSVQLLVHWLLKRCPILSSVLFLLYLKTYNETYCMLKLSETCCIWVYRFYTQWDDHSANNTAPEISFVYIYLHCEMNVLLHTWCLTWLHCHYSTQCILVCSTV